MNSSNECEVTTRRGLHGEFFPSLEVKAAPGYNFLLDKESSLKGHPSKENSETMLWMSSK